jgi:hypothetical protein
MSQVILLEINKKNIQVMKIFLTKLDLYKDEYGFNSVIPNPLYFEKVNHLYKMLTK